MKRGTHNDIQGKRRNSFITTFEKRGEREKDTGNGRKRKRKKKREIDSQPNFVIPVAEIICASHTKHKVCKSSVQCGRIEIPIVSGNYRPSR